MSKITRRTLLSTLAMAPAAAAMAQTEAPPEAAVYIISPRDGQRVRNPIVVRFGLRNMGVTQASSAARNAGHHHLLIDVDDPVDPKEPLPSDKNHLHYGGGQTEARIELTPGRHTLQLVLGDADHRPFTPLLQSQKIRIFVGSPRAAKAKK